MKTALRRLCFAGALILPLGCGSGTSEIGPATSTTEMTVEEQADMKKGMEESLKHMPKDQQEKYKKLMEQNEKSSD